MIENLPRDHAALRDEEELVLRLLYDLFDARNDAVDGASLNIEASKTISRARSVMQSQTMRQYMYRVDPQDRWAPKLRAALRLSKSRDLGLADDLFQLLRSNYTPTSNEVSREALTKA